MSSIDIYPVIPVTSSKVCTKCNIYKLLTEFSKDKRAKDTYDGRCKLCAKEYRDNNKEHSKEYKQINKERDKEYNKEYQKEYNQANKKQKQKRDKEYKQSNKGLINFNSAKRRATKLKATPKWVELDSIKQLYIDCNLISEMTNAQYHVDHIVPLISEIVCGLHCIANLQIITAEENLSKSNLYWPDM